MRICKFRDSKGHPAVGCLENNRVIPLRLPGKSYPTLTQIICSDDPPAFVSALEREKPISVSEITIQPPLDDQEVWAAGVTYQRSKVAREEESAQTGAARFYDMVYTAKRPELFFKSPSRRVVAPGKPVRIRRDSRWNVPEPELALVLNPRLQIVGYTIGNDMSSRDIEGENPLYLPQAKMYDGCCSLGPVITLRKDLPPPDEVHIQLRIIRKGAIAFEGKTHLGKMARSLEDLAGWLGKELSFPEGVILLTGTGVVPPDDFTLAIGDDVSIEIHGIGTLQNPVA